MTSLPQGDRTDSGRLKKAGISWMRQRPLQPNLMERHGAVVHIPSYLQAYSWAMQCLHHLSYIYIIYII